MSSGAEFPNADSSAHFTMNMGQNEHDLHAGNDQNIGLDNANFGSSMDEGSNSVDGGSANTNKGKAKQYGPNGKHEQKESHDGSSAKNGHNVEDPNVSDDGRDNATKTNGKQSYASLFKTNRVPVEGSQLKFITPPEGKIILDLEDIDSVEETHGYCLIGYVMGPRPSPYAVLTFIKGWGEKVKFFFKENGWIQFEFPNEVDRDRVLNGGYYMLGGCQLFLKKLPSCFMFRKEDMEFIPTWVQIYGLPKQCWTHLALSKIASVIGKPIHTDLLTKSKQGAKYARVLLELDAKKPKVSDYEVQMTTTISTVVKFIYEFEPKYCDKCKSVGHIAELCGVSTTRKPRPQQRNRGNTVPNRDHNTEVPKETNGADGIVETTVEQQTTDLNPPKRTHVHYNAETVQQPLDVQQQSRDKGKGIAETHINEVMGQNREIAVLEGDNSFDDLASNEVFSDDQDADSDDVEDILSHVVTNDKEEWKTVNRNKSKTEKKKTQKERVKEKQQGSESSSGGTGQVHIGMGSGKPIQGGGHKNGKKKSTEVRPPDTASVHL